MNRARCAAVVALATLAGRAQALPPGFIRTLLVQDFGAVTSIAPLPGGRVLYADLYGRVSIATAGQPSLPLIAINDVSVADERGLLGITVDPAFGTNGYFYVLYTTAGPYNRVARFTVVNDTVDPASRVVIWQNPGLCLGASHQGGGINFGPDGNLYIATGDQYDTPSNAQTLVNQHGKILRLAPDGSIPPDNPYVNTPGAQPAIWCLGLRNPYRFTIDQPTGNLWIGDVGENTYEEINRGHVAANFGWPFMEGPNCSISNCSQYTLPVSWYLHHDPVYTPMEAAVICGPIYRGSAFPAEYHGNLFYGDFGNGWIKRLVFDQSGQVIANLDFDAPEQCRTLVDLKLGQDGCLYYAQIQESVNGPAGVYRIAATQGANQAPVVVAAGQPQQGNAPLTVQFSSAGTSDPDNGPQALSYLWTFGDGQTSTQPSVSHEYTQRGLYQATLAVSDGADTVTSPQISITVGHAPVPVIATPVEGFEYSAGDTINYSGTATDIEDGTLGASAFTWKFVIAHLNHEHPLMAPVSGVQGGSFVIPTTWHDPEHTHYRIYLTVRDSDNIPTTVARDIVPRESVIDFATVPSGIPLFLDGRALATPEEYESLVGFHHEVTAQPSFVINDSTYYFDHWSNGQPASFSFTSPVGGLSLTAVYRVACNANCDESTVPPILNANDFQCFLNRYAMGDPYVNCDGSTVPPVVNANDFQCFLNAFAVGCSR